MRHIVDRIQHLADGVEMATHRADLLQPQLGIHANEGFDPNHIPQFLHFLTPGWVAIAFNLHADVALKFADLIKLRVNLLPRDRQPAAVRGLHAAFQLMADRKTESA